MVTTSGKDVGVHKAFSGTRSGYLDWFPAWTVTSIGEHVFQYRFRSWRNAFWEVSYDTGQAYFVTEDTPGAPASRVLLQGVKPAVNQTAERDFFVPGFEEALLIYEPSTGAMSLEAGGTHVTESRNWDVRTTAPGIYHVRNRLHWKDSWRIKRGSSR